MRILVMLVSLIVGASLVAQQRTTIKFGTGKIDMTCSNKAAAGFFKNIEIRSTDTPIRIYFMKNDKTVMDVSGSAVYISYEQDTRGDDVAAVTVDQKNFWGVKVIYFVTATVPNKYVDINGEQKEVAGHLNLDYLGLPLWISRTSKS